MVPSGIGGHSEKEAMQTLIPVSSGPMVGRWKLIGEWGREEWLARRMWKYRVGAQKGKGKNMMQRGIFFWGRGGVLMSALWVHTHAAILCAGQAIHDLCLTERNALNPCDWVRGAVHHIRFATCMCGAEISGHGSHIEMNSH